MKTPLRLRLLLATLGLFAAAHSLHAQVAGEVVVTNTAVSIISITNTTLSVPDPTAGAIKGGAGVASEAGAVLRITTNETNRRITVSRNALPTGAVFTVALGTHNSSFTGGTETTVATTATDFITGISNLASDLHDPSGIPLIYDLTLAEDTPAGGFTVALTYTITAGS